MPRIRSAACNARSRSLGGTLPPSRFLLLSCHTMHAPPCIPCICRPPFLLIVLITNEKGKRPPRSLIPHSPLPPPQPPASTHHSSFVDSTKHRRVSPLLDLSPSSLDID